MNNDMEQVYPVIEDNGLSNRFISDQNSYPKSATPNRSEKYFFQKLVNWVMAECGLNQSAGTVKS